MVLHKIQTGGGEKKDGISFVKENIQALHRKLLNVVPAKVENNAEISKNIFENYIIQREFIARRDKTLRLRSG